MLWQEGKGSVQKQGMWSLLPRPRILALSPTPTDWGPQLILTSLALILVTYKKNGDDKTYLVILM